VGLMRRGVEGELFAAAATTAADLVTLIVTEREAPLLFRDRN
jgi:hypothetical protein